MNFLFPTYLYALGLVLLPIIIHFFNFQRAKRVYFTNVAFLQTVKEVTNARNRLKHLLILLMRVLFIAALVVAFAQPFLPNEEVADAQPQGGNFTSVYIDNSYSMQQQRDNRQLLNWGVEYAEQITKAFPKNMRYQLLDNRMDGNMRYFSEGDKMLEKLTTLDFCNTGRELPLVYQKQLEALGAQDTPDGNRIFWISDFQKSNIPNLADLRPDTTQQLFLIPLSPNSNSNLYIDSIWLETPFIKVQENDFLHVRLANHGEEEIEDRVVKLFLDDNQVSSSTVSIPAGGTEELRMNFAASTAGDHKGRIEVEDYPMTFDNEYFFVLKVAPQIDIVSISGDNSVFVKEVYANEPFFRLSHFSIQAVDYTALNNADLIVLTNLTQIDPALQATLLKAVDAGSSLAIFPHEQSALDSYAGITGVQIKQATQTAKQGLSAPDAQNPFFDGVFERVSSSMSMPMASPLFSWGNVGKSMLNFKTGQPFLSMLSKGKGQVYLFASPLKEPFTDFPKHAVFVPIMYKLALSSKQSAERLSYSFDEDLAIVELQPDAPAQETYKLQQAGFELIPGQRLANGQLLIDVPRNNMEAGCYEVRATKQGSALVGTVAFNYGVAESKLSYYTAEELREHFKDDKQVTVFDQIDTARFADTFLNQHIAQPLWRYFVILALAFLLAEVLLVRFWKS